MPRRQEATFQNLSIIPMLYQLHSCQLVSTVQFYGFVYYEYYYTNIATAYPQVDVESCQLVQL